MPDNNGQGRADETPPPTAGPLTRAQNARKTTHMTGNTRDSTNRMPEAHTRALLEKSGYLLDDDEINATTLATILKQIANCSGKVPKTLTDGIKAVATLLESKHTETIAEEASTKVMDMITPSIERLAEDVERISAATGELRGKVNAMEAAHDQNHQQDPRIMNPDEVDEKAKGRLKTDLGLNWIVDQLSEHLEFLLRSTKNAFNNIS
jgi:hypothetical protein